MRIIYIIFASLCLFACSKSDSEKAPVKQEYIVTFKKPFEIKSKRSHENPISDNILLFECSRLMKDTNRKISCNVKYLFAGKYELSIYYDSSMVKVVTYMLTQEQKLLYESDLVKVELGKT